MTDEHSKNGANSTPLDRFSDVLDMHGSRPENWPDNERNALLHLSQSNAAAHRMLQEARALDTALDHATDIGDLSLLEADIISRISLEDSSADIAQFPGKTKQPDSPRAEVRPYLHGAALLAASLVIGIFIGMSDTVTRIYSPDQEADMAILFIAEEEDLPSGEENLL